MITQLLHLRAKLINSCPKSAENIKISPKSIAFPHICALFPVISDIIYKK